MSACTRQQPFYANLLIRIDLQCTYTCEKRLSLIYNALTRGGEYVTQFIATNSELRFLNHPLRVYVHTRILHGMVNGILAVMMCRLFAQQLAVVCRLTIPYALYVPGSPPAAFCLARTGRHHVMGGLPTNRLI